MIPKRLARRCVLTAALAPIALLAGCPKENADTPAAPPAQVTAPALAPQQPTPSASSPDLAATAQAAQSARRAQQLIDQVEKDYRSGVANYTSGRLDAARADFDLAVDTMLSSGLDLKADPTLADEFDHLLDRINSLEMDALKQGNGLSPSIEDAPLDAAAADLAFTANPELTARLNAQLKTTQSDFPLVVNDYVAGYINYFTNSPAGHAHLLRSLERAGKYKDMISKDLRDAGVPQDLIYLAVAESGFQPQVVNAQSGAGGMWQFMPTGAYGLTRNGWFDERFDPEKSSKEYAKYIKELYNQFGDWYLAMAAYNWGPGNVQKAVMRTGYADFWELYRRNSLPTATKNYVPGIIAAIIMAKNPQQYGLDRMVPDEPVVSDTVTTDYAIDLRLVADVTDSSVQEIVALNPSLLRMTTPRDMDFDLHIPPGTKDVYTDRLKSIPEEKRASWRFHTVKPGESLEAIATSLHSRASEIASANGIAIGDGIEPGDELVIPIATASSSAARTLHYTTKRGDTLVTVADRFNVSTKNLRAWNHLASNAIKPGRLLTVSEPVHLAPSIHARGHASRSGSSKPSAPRTRESRRLLHPAHGIAKASSNPASKTSAKARTSKAADKSKHGNKKAAR
jgi:membrane-bound lytic murein transglycosylase D